MLKKAMAGGADSAKPPSMAGMPDSDSAHRCAIEDGATRGVLPDQYRAPAEYRHDSEVSALHVLPVAIYTSSRGNNSGKTWISPGVEELTGFSPSRFIYSTRFWSSRIHPEDRPKVDRELGCLMGTGRASLEYRFQCADGTYRWIMDRMVLPPGLTTTFGIMQDMDPNKRIELALRNRNEFLEMLVDGAAHGVMVLDEGSNLLYLNPLFAEKLGHSSSDWVKKQAKIGFHPDDSRTGLKTLSDALRGAPGQCEVRIGNTDGTYRYVKLFMSPLAWRGRKLALCIAGDISKEKQAEQQRTESLRMGMEDLLRGAVAALAPYLSRKEAMRRIRSNLGEGGEALLEAFGEKGGK